MKKKKEKKSDLHQTREYVAFLEKSMKSKNFKNNDPERYAKEKVKLERARLKLKLLEGKI